MKKLNKEIDVNLSSNNEFYSQDDAKFFSEAPAPVKQAKEQVEEPNKAGEVEVEIKDSADENLKTLSFWSYMKSIHTHPIKTLQEKSFPKLAFGIYHMVIAAFIIGIAITINAFYKVGLPSWESIPASIALCTVVALVPFGVSLFNNFFVSTFIFIFAKSLNIHYEKGDYHKMLGYLFPTTALISSVLTFFMMLNIRWSGIEMQIAIATSIISVIPAIMSYRALKSIGKKSALVCIVLVFWVAVCYFLMKHVFWSA